MATTILVFGLASFAPDCGRPVSVEMEDSYFPHMQAKLVRVKSHGAPVRTGSVADIQPTKHEPKSGQRMHGVTARRPNQPIIQNMFGDTWSSISDINIAALKNEPNSTLVHMNRFCECTVVALS